MQEYFLNPYRKGGQIYWDAIEIEVEVEVDFCRKTGNLSGYSAKAFSRRILLLIIEGLVFASAFCICTRRHAFSAGKCKLALGFFVGSILFNCIVVRSQQGMGCQP